MVHGEVTGPWFLAANRTSTLLPSQSLLVFSGGKSIGSLNVSLMGFLLFGG
jgi:hypothetical protein